MESVEHIFFSCSLAQQVWRYATNIMWQLFGNLIQWYNAYVIKLSISNCNPLARFGFCEKMHLLDYLVA